MAILLVNKKTLQVSVQSKPGEKVSKDRDLTNIQEESEKLGKRYKKLYKEYQYEMIKGIAEGQKFFVEMAI